MASDRQLDDFFGEQAGLNDEKETIKQTVTRRLSIRSRLRLLPKVLSFRERYIVVGLMIAILGGIIAVPIAAYIHYTIPVPTNGGSLTEGVLGEPRTINPLLLQASEADRDIAALVYAGLMRYNGTGQLIPDLAQSHPEITSDGLTYTIQLRSDARWHDGRPVTADDVVFTVNTAQNPDYASFLLPNWSGVKVEKVSDFVVSFKLERRYPQFLNTLTMGILPRHLWEDIRPINFPLSELNIKPVGSGPFKFSALNKDKQGRVLGYELVAHEDHHGRRAYLDGITFKFYADGDQLIRAFNENEIDSIGFVTAASLNELKFGRRIILERLQLPRYFALFFNQTQSVPLEDKNVRLALAHATNRVAIINEVLDGNAFLVDSPLLGGVLDINQNVPSYDFDLDLAKQILTESGWAEGEDGIRERRGEKLELTIVTSTWHELVSTAHLIAEQWRDVGANVTVETIPVNQLNRDVIAPRAYQILLFGQVLALDPDPFTLWHSSQFKPPGGNLSLYENQTADRLLDEARTTGNPLERSALYDELQRVIIDDIPAVFLYSPYYLYGRPVNIHGFDTDIIALPSERFTNAASWFTNTKRVLRSSLPETTPTPTPSSIE